MALVQVKSLEEICFTHILWTLEEFAVDCLVLLPKYFRNRMLHKLPVVDICQLEDTQFTSGLYINTVWEKIYKDRINPYHSSSQQTWRERFLSTLYSTILKDVRPYGYFRVMKNGGRQSVGSDITEDRPVYDHPVDIVNYLVAMKCEKNPTDEKNPEVDISLYDTCQYGPLHVVMNRHEVTLVKGIVPPGIKYHQACQSKQLIPPRYSKFLSKGSCFLPDFTAIELINKECKFCPREVNIFVSEFSTFLQNAQCERSNLDYLSDFFQEVESLTIEGEIERNLNGRVICGAKAIASSEEIPAMVLGLILSNTTPNLVRLNINVTKTKDDVIPSITPVLTSSYNGLKEISIHARGKVSPDLLKLISITEHQSILHTISISISEIVQSGNLCSFGPVVKTTPTQVSFSILCSWIQICFKKPSLYHLKVSLSPVSAEAILQILIIFLSTPCSHDQTLTFSFIQNLIEDIKSSKSEFHSMSKKKTSFSYGSGESLPFEMKSSKLEPHPPFDFNCDILPLPHQFDDTLTLQYKSLTFDHCSIKPSFTASVFGLQLKLKQLVIDDYYVLNPSVFSTMTQPGFDIQSVRISSMSMHGITFNDYSSLFQKKSLRNVRFINCSSVDTKAIHEAATLSGFHLVEESLLDKSVAVPSFQEKFTYTFTRK